MTQQRTGKQAKKKTKEESQRVKTKRQPGVKNVSDKVGSGDS